MYIIIISYCVLNETKPYNSKERAIPQRRNGAWHLHIAELRRVLHGEVSDALGRVPQKGQVQLRKVGFISVTTPPSRRAPMNPSCSTTSMTAGAETLSSASTRAEIKLQIFNKVEYGRHKSPIEYFQSDLRKYNKINRLDKTDYFQISQSLQSKKEFFKHE